MTRAGAAAASLATFLLLARAAGADEPAVVLPEAMARLTAAHYAPADADFQWTGSVGAEVGLVHWRATTLYGLADVETIVGNERRAFDANQASYHLDAGLRRAFGRVDVALHFAHTSRHAEDREKVAAVDWNLLGVTIAGRLPRGLPASGRFALGLGRTTLTSFVDYRWELTTRLDLDLLTRDWGQIYLHANLRLVTTDDSKPYRRTGFTDLLVESGARFPRGVRSLEVFAAFEHRNDVFLMTPGARDRALFGCHVGFGNPTVR